MDWNERYAGDEFLWGKEPNARLVAEIDELPAGRALDLACGEGRNAIWLAQRGWNVTAVDLSDVALDKARKLAAIREVDVDWLHADVQDYEPDRRAYDLVIVFFLHLPPDARKRVIARASEAVADGGTLLIAAHHIENLEHGHGGPQDPLLLPTESELAGEVLDLEIDMAEPFVRQVDDTTKAIDALVRAHRPAQ